MAKRSRNKKRGGIIALIVIGSIIGCIALFAGIIAIINVSFYNGHIDMIKEITPVGTSSKYEPILDEENNAWTFVTDENFKVMQLTDIHIGGGAFSNWKDDMAINAVAKMIQAEKPDLVIATGDIAYPVPFQSGTFNNKKEAEIFATLMEQLDVYWAVVFGNHDTEIYSYYSREDISNVYSEDRWEHCLFLSGDSDVDGYGNYNINVQNSKGITTHTYILMDSHAYRDTDKFGIKWDYDNIHENQVEWYRKTIERVNRENLAAFENLSIVEKGLYLASIGATTLPTVQSSLFFHIPLVEYKDAWTEYQQNGYKDTEDMQYITGKMGEENEMVCCGVGEDNLFETVLELGSTKNIFCGHDHLNNIRMRYKGVYLNYGMSIDHLAYPGIWKQTEQRGCTVIMTDTKGNLTVSLNKLTDYE